MIVRCVLDIEVPEGQDEKDVLEILGTLNDDLNNEDFNLVWYYHVENFKDEEDYNERS